MNAPALLLVLLMLAPTMAAPTVATGFADPPRDAGNRCWWWWLNGNVDKAAITRDLEQMAAKGFSGACIFDAGGAEQRGNAPVPAGPLFGSPAWRELFVHAVNEAHRLGLMLSLNIQSGWNLGGPDVTPAEATKHLTWSETRVTGPTAFRGPLPPPASRDGWYRDIAVLAVPVTGAAAARVAATASSQQTEHPADAAADGRAETFWVSNSTAAGGGPTPAQPQWLQLSVATPARCGGVRWTGRPGYGPKSGSVAVSADGHTFTPAAGFTATDGQDVVVRFPAQAVLAVRVSITAAFDPRFPAAPRNVQVAECQLLDGDGRPVGTARPPIRDLAIKSGFAEVGGSAPDTRFLLTDVPSRPGEADCRAADVIDLSDRLDRDGTLVWQPPAGTWSVLRFGYTPSGARISTSSEGWQGRVIDYLHDAPLRRYWRTHVAPLLTAIGPLCGTTLQLLQTDSWELGGINWTDDFAERFRHYRGYDVLPWLPVIAGRVVDDRQASNAFLADFRKTLADLIADRHYAVFAELARAHGLGIQPESAGPHAGPFDGLRNFGHSAVPMGEFWVPSPHRPRPQDRFFVKQAASAAHLYGQRLVGAESFTSIGPHWNDTLWAAQKPSFDHEVCNGLNLALLHTFTCSPASAGVPGQEYFAGTHINPQVTWWDLSQGFFDYLRRVQWVTQHGRFVADALAYAGDHVPNITRYKDDDPARVLPGFDYDSLNEEVLLTRLSVDDGRLALPDGMRYRLLTLPDHQVMSLAALRRVRELVAAGATVVGPQTLRCVSLTGGAAAQAEVRRLAEELWGAQPAAQGERRVGRGRVVWGRSAREVLLSDGVAPDFEARDAAPEARFEWIHYRLDEADAWFVCNQTASVQSLQAVFRVAGRQPELWDPLTGRQRVAGAFAQAAGRTRVPLTLGPQGSLFVVFRDAIAADRQGSAGSNEPQRAPLATLTGPWTVAFEPAWGGPAAVTFDTLVSWTERPEPGVRAYSGRATYSTACTLPAPPPGGRLELVLGDVRDIGVARVRVNGRDCGLTWTPPFAVDITAAAQGGVNQVEVEVANGWRNRLLADAALPSAQRLTHTNIAVQRDWQPLPAGLLGPVQVCTVR